jgi:N-acetylneuraminate synthase
MEISGTQIGNSAPPYIIAEMSGNHQGSLDKALKLLQECAAAGVNAFKLQTYSADSLTIQSDRPEYIVDDGPWKGRTLYDLYSQGQTPREWVEPLIELGNELGVAVFSSPFSPEDVDFLESLNVPAYKVASFEINYQQLFTRIIKTGKPIIFSTGLATLDEIQETVSLLKEHKAENFALLKCTTAYPAQLQDLNLATINYLKEKYRVDIGFSDHTEGFLASVSAIAQGATIIEKHVKLDEDDTSVDSSFSLPVSELKNFIEMCHSTKKTIGDIQDGPTPSEKSYLKYRRSIVAIRDIEKGTVIQAEDLAIVRPDTGLAPKNLNSIIGRKASVRIEKSQGISPTQFQ